MSLIEQQTHFQWWCIVKSPLLLSNDINKLEEGSDILKLISNKDLIAINQDALGLPALCVKNCDNTDIKFRDWANTG